LVTDTKKDGLEQTTIEKQKETTSKNIRKTNYKKIKETIKCQSRNICCCCGCCKLSAFLADNLQSRQQIYLEGNATKLLCQHMQNYVKTILT